MRTIVPETAHELGERVGLSPEISAFVVPALVVVVAFLAGWAIEAALIRVVRPLAARTRTKLDDVLASAIHGSVKWLATFVGVAIAILLTPVPGTVRYWTERFLSIVVILAVVIAVARVAGALVATYGERARLVGTTRSLVRRVVVIALYVVGALVILDTQGIAITPLLTTVGLAGLALALALQDTLSNLFAGIWVQADRPLDVGHYVKLHDMNIEGIVEEVGWRTTKVRTLSGNLVVVPNSRVAQSVVTDFDLPTPRMSLLVQVPVGRDADPRRVEAILVDESAKASREIPGMLADPAPFVRFIPGFTDMGYEFTLIAQVATFVDQYLVQHELRHRIVERFRREGIALPYPVRIMREPAG